MVSDKQIEFPICVDRVSYRLRADNGPQNRFFYAPLIQVKGDKWTVGNCRK